MTFSVSVTEIRIGDFVETFPAMLEVWSEDDYRRQWADALDALERDGRAFLVTWAPPAGDDLWTVWELWRVGDEVRIRNSLLRPPITIEPYAPDDEVSEWTASIDEVAVFRATLE